MPCQCSLQARREVTSDESALIMHTKETCNSMQYISASLGHRFVIQGLQKKKEVSSIHSHLSKAPPLPPLYTTLSFYC